MVDECEGVNKLDIDIMVPVNGIRISKNLKGTKRMILTQSVIQEQME